MNLFPRTHTRIACPATMVGLGYKEPTCDELYACSCTMFRNCARKTVSKIYNISIFNISLVSQFSRISSLMIKFRVPNVKSDR